MSASTHKTTELLSVEIFTAALTSGQVKRAIELGDVMTSTAKDIARDIWGSWKNLCAGQNLPSCPF